MSKLVAAELLLTEADAADAIPADAPGLKAGILRLSEEQRRCEERLREFFAAENPGQGIFYASEIYALQQEKLRREVEIEFHRRKLARRELGDNDF